VGNKEVHHMLLAEGFQELLSLLNT